MCEMLKRTGYFFLEIMHVVGGAGVLVLPRATNGLRYTRTESSTIKTKGLVGVSNKFSNATAYVAAASTNGSNQYEYGNGHRHCSALTFCEPI